MIVVIQCASGKRREAGRMRTQDGRKVEFVADPARAPRGDVLYARPDDPSGTGETWREQVSRYNDESADENPLGLLRAADLYENAIYSRLAGHVGLANLYILSAGWGLIAGTFLTPYYDITFSAQADPWKRRRRQDRYRDFCMLPVETRAPIVFFGGRDYLPLFASLTAQIAAPKTAYFNSAEAPDLPGITAVPFATTRRTNWHYECAEAFIAGRLESVQS